MTHETRGHGRAQVRDHGRNGDVHDGDVEQRHEHAERDRRQDPPLARMALVELAGHRLGGRLPEITSWRRPFVRLQVVRVVAGIGGLRTTPHAGGDQGDESLFECRRYRREPGGDVARVEQAPARAPARRPAPAPRARPAPAAGAPRRGRRRPPASRRAATTTAVVSPTISSARPAATTRPALRTTRRSHCSASSMACVVASTPAPPSAAPRMVSQSLARPSGSTPDVGSSSTSSSGSWARAAAKASRRRSPSGRSRTRVASRSARSGSSVATAWRPKASREKARFSRHGEVFPEAEPLGHVAQAPARLAVGRCAEQAHRPRARRQQAEQQADQGRLAGAVGAQQADDLAGQHGEVDVVDGREGAEPARGGRRLGERGGGRHDAASTAFAGERAASAATTTASARSGASSTASAGSEPSADQ